MQSLNIFATVYGPLTTFRCHFSLLLCWLLVSANSWAVSLEPSLQDIAELQTQLTKSAQLSEQEVSRAADQLILARRQLIALQARRSDVESYRVEAATYTQRSASLQNDIQVFLDTPAIEATPAVTESALSARAAELESTVRELRHALFRARDSEFWLNDRAQVIAQEFAIAAEQFSTTKSQSLGADAEWQRSMNAEAASTAARVNNFFNLVQAHVAFESIDLLQRELSTLAPRQTLASLESRALQIRLDKADKELDLQWRLLTRRRIAHVRAQLAKLTDDTETNPTIIKNNSVLVQARLQLLEQELPLLQRTSAAAQSIINTHRVRQVLTQITDTGTVSESLATMIRTLRDELPDTAALKNELKLLQRRQRALQVNQILWEGRLAETRGINQFFTASSSVSGQGLPKDTLEQQVALVNVANRLSDQMTTLQAALLEARTRASDVRSALEGSVLWLRTNESAGLHWVAYGYSALQWMLSVETWRGVVSAILPAMQYKAVPLTLAGLCIIALVASRRRLKILINRTATEVGNVGEDSYWTTPLALLLSLIMALPIPLIILSLYWIVSDVFVVSGSVVPALNTSLLATAGVLLVLLLFKSLSRKDGVLSRHFAWNEHSVKQLNRHLNWFVWVYALGTTAYTFAINSGRLDLRFSMGASAFLLVSLAMSGLFYACFQPNRGVAFAISESKINSAFTRLGIWTLIVLPTIVGLLPFIGFFDTAVEMQHQAFRTGTLMMSIVVLIGFVTREFMVAHRRMSLRKAKAKRATQEAERSAQEDIPNSGDATPDLSFAWDDDYKHTAHEAQQLFKLLGIVLFLIGAWNVWKPLFPVLDVFNDIVLWQASSVSGASSVYETVTLGTLLFAVTVILIGVMGSRNLRGVLELLVFERLKLDQGTRYAINAIASYTLLGTTFLIAVAQLGVDWSKLQWFVAALGVGLGFGLQEIVANFICGLIILFERPVRVGDIVTIGGVSGTVSNIQIRATTITDFDNRDVVLPNKSIITEDVTNWTLHDSVTRILLSIGVAYGSDIEQVRELLVQCIENTDNVLDTPEPTVFFMNHGASSLDFEIRAFVATPAHRLPVTHALNSAVNGRLAANGIEIPFPQRVVHMAPTSSQPVEL